MAKIYTTTGDDGTSGLIGGSRVPKSDPHLQAVGTVDELNAALGIVRAEMARASQVPDDIDRLVGSIQHRLFNLGAELATPGEAAPVGEMLDDDHVDQLERAIDRHDGRLEPLTEFILPGGTPLAAELHLARAICRRAERLIVVLSAAEPVRPVVIQYLNRLSDLLFVLARAANQAAGVGDVVWRKDA